MEAFANLGPTHYSSLATRRLKINNSWQQFHLHSPKLKQVYTRYVALLVCTQALGVTADAFASLGSSLSTHWLKNTNIPAIFGAQFCLGSLRASSSITITTLNWQNTKMRQKCMHLRFLLMNMRPKACCHLRLWSFYNFHPFTICGSEFPSCTMHCIDPLEQIIGCKSLCD